MGLCAPSTQSVLSSPAPGGCDTCLSATRPWKLASSRHAVVCTPASVPPPRSAPQDKTGPRKQKTGRKASSCRPDSTGERVSCVLFGEETGKEAHSRPSGPHLQEANLRSAPCQGCGLCFPSCWKSPRVLFGWLASKRVFCKQGFAPVADRPVCLGHSRPLLGLRVNSGGHSGFQRRIAGGLPRP